MADFNNHLSQAKRNINFLSIIDSENSIDWKVTVAFYSALHLINAHIAHISDLHYITHRDLEQYLNPNNPMSLCRLDEDTYTDYKLLLNLSRRSRYLLNEVNPSLNAEIAHFTEAKHYKKALKYLNNIMKFMENNYQNSFQSINISSVNISNLDFFKYSEIIV